MSLIKFVVPLALTVFVAGSHAVAQNVYVDMAAGIAQQGLAQADELVASAPNQLRKSLNVAIEGHDFESEEFCLGNIQAVVNMASVLSNMMPFSEVWTLEDERGPVGKLRVMLNGQRAHTEVFCDGMTLKALELPWGVGVAVPQKFTNTSLSALLGVGLNFKLQGLLDNEIEPSPERLSSTGSGAINTNDDVAAALADALAAISASNVAARSPTNGPEMEEIFTSISSCWSVDPGSQAARVTLTVRFDLDQSGNVIGDVRQVSAVGGDAGAKEIAFQAARRAILRCLSGGYKLSADTYDQWKEIEMTFDPREGVSVDGSTDSDN